MPATTRGGRRRSPSCGTQCEVPVTELLSNPLVDFAVKAVLPALSVIGALVAVVVASWSGRTAYLTLVRSVTPQVHCYLRVRPSSQVFDLVIANFGLGSVYSVNLEIQADEEDFEAHHVIMEWRRTEFPFSIIEPGGHVATMFGTGPSLLGTEVPLKPFRATVTYEWQPFWKKRRWFERRQYDLDVRPFGVIIPEWKEDEVAKVLKKELPEIAKAIGVTRRPRTPADRKVGSATVFARVEQLMPDLLDEMQSDVAKHPLKREFILMGKQQIYNSGGRSVVAYYYEDHDDLDDKVGLLARQGLVVDITYNNTDRYLMSEALVEYLVGRGHKSVDAE